MRYSDWKIPYSQPNIPKELINAGFNPLLAAILSLRGINSVIEAKRIVEDEPCIYDPFLLQGMAAAVERIKLAAERREHVAVYGDYDVDGITSTCIMCDFLGSIGLKCDPYIPDRGEEGYGINCSALDSLKALGVSLVISVDCGITAIEETEYAHSIGIDVIITDHHECKDGILPPAVAVIDPKQDGNRYPNICLAGVGVALKLACACASDEEEIIDRYADLVAVGTVADVMPLTGENRYLVKKGLKMLSEGSRPGLEAMFRESSIDKTRLNSTTIGFILAPRLNAAGRLDQAMTAAKLLMSTDSSAAAELAKELCELNRQRQSIENGIWAEAKAILADSEPDAPIVLASDKWHQGVIGIAASRLAEHYSLPTIMVCLNGETGKGSCRSFGGFNLFEALSACSEHLLGFGGHALAAGLNISRDKLDVFRSALAEYYRSNRPVPQPLINCDILIKDPKILSIENVRSLDLLEPYGNGNPKPMLCISGARIDSFANVGAGKHLRIHVSFAGEFFDGIFFSHTAEEFELHEGDLVDIAFCPQINTFRGHLSVQLLISALRHHSCEELSGLILNCQNSANYAAASYCPSRQHFVSVWRYIQGCDFVTADSVQGIIRQCPDFIEPERWCICLMVLLEVGLLASDDGTVFNAHPARIVGKADLEGTKLIRALRAL